MRVLVTNDDGVGSPGIVALAREVAGAGHDLVVAAPSADLSGSSAAIGGMHADESIDVEPVELPGLAGVPAFAVAAPPALIVIASRLGAFGPAPDLVASGINPGPNTGRAVLHSGTVGAALTAANLGVSGLAVSVDVGDPLRWGTAAVVAGAALEWLAGQPDETVLNLNVPDRVLDDVGGVPLGVGSPEDPYQVGSRRLEPGERLLIYSDGVSERRTPDGRFGLEGVQRALATAPSRSASSAAASLTAQVLAASPDDLRDDATVLMLAPGQPPMDQRLR
ncbi:MAG: SpoIIE family protein phosphatase [Actinobacteria bacterium]|nr:SpoIIE family protein phosphatase [Actinomycetota bacterium]